MREVDAAERKLTDFVRGRLSPWRFHHSLRVAATARRLAARHGADPERAWLAGLLHDCARELPAADLVRAADRRGLLDQAGAPLPELLHALVGAAVAREELGIEDEEVLSAIARHTTGEAGMGAVELAVFVADYVEPGRSFPGVEEVRRVAEESLSRAALLALEQTVSRLAEAGRPVDARSVRALDDLRRRAAGGSRARAAAHRGGESG